MALPTLEEYNSNPHFQKLTPLEQAATKAILLGYEINDLYHRPLEIIDTNDSIQLSVVLATLIYGTQINNIAPFFAQNGINVYELDQCTIIDGVSRAFYEDDTPDHPRIMNITTLSDFVELQKSRNVKVDVQAVLKATINLILEQIKQKNPARFDVAQNMFLAWEKKMNAMKDNQRPLGARKTAKRPNDSTDNEKEENQLDAQNDGQKAAKMSKQDLI